MEQSRVSLESSENGTAIDEYCCAHNIDVSHQVSHQLHNEVIRNWSNSNSEEQYDISKLPALRGIILAFYVSVILVGIIGNGVVLYIVARNKNMQNITNLFIANLALSDIGLCVFSLPVQLHYQMTDKWIFGEKMCRVVFAAFAIPMYVSTTTILLIAFDRYWLILFPLKHRMTMRLACFLIALSVVVSILLSTPVMVYSSLHHIREPDIGIYRTYCLEYWPNHTARVVYTLLMFIFQFCLPLGLTALLYYRIYFRLRHRPAQRTNQNERKHKTNKILVAIVTLFVICWLPWNLYSVVAEINSDIVKGPHFKFVDLLLKVFAMGSACVNPFLYCWLNDNFRKELDNIGIRLHILRDSGATRHPEPTFNNHVVQDGNLLMVADNMSPNAHEKSSMTRITVDRATYYPDDINDGFKDSPHYPSDFLQQAEV